MIPELVVSVLACSRIGVVHCVAHSGCGAKSLAHQIQDCGAKWVITADFGFRRGLRVPFKGLVVKAAEDCPDIQHIMVWNRTSDPCGCDDPLEISMRDFSANRDAPEHVAPEPMNARDPLFILYTSGSTGPQRGVVHTHGGYLLYAAMTARLALDLKPGHVIWNTEEIAWITGHSYGLYGPLLNGATSVLFEGVADYPTVDRYWEVLEKYRVGTFCVVPTTVRRLMESGTEGVGGRDVGSLNLLVSMEEPLDEKTWQWYFERVGQGRVPIVDAWTQTEAGGLLFSPFPGTGEMKPGYVGRPFFGVEPVVLDPDTGDETEYPDQEGVLCVRAPWPGIAGGVFGAKHRFLETYFARVPGLFFTGDGALKDNDGNFRVTGRIDDVINRGGHRLGTGELERILVSHDQVSEAAVVGFPHPLAGRGVYCFVHLNHSSRGSEELKRALCDFVELMIGSLARLDIIQWVDTLPRTPSGKILKVLLQRIAAGDVDDLGDISRVADAGVVESLVKGRLTLG